MNDEPFDRDAYAMKLLRFLADGGRFEDDQIGASHTLEQISVAEGLIEMGYMRGHAIQDGSGVAVCIGGPGVTGQGRRFLKSQTIETQSKPATASTEANATASVSVGALSVSDHGKLVQQFRCTLSELAKRLTADLGTERLNSHVERIASVKQNLDQIDLYDLTFVPERILLQIKSATQELVTLFDEKLISAGDLERRHVQEFDRHGPLQLTHDNLSKWSQQIENSQVTVFNVSAPLLMHQTRRRLERSIGSNVSLSVSPNDLPDDAVVWKYFPIRNFIRCAQASGIWMSSMSKLREWPSRHQGIPDLREGEVPPALEAFKKEFEVALAIDAAFERLKAVYPFIGESSAAVDEALETVYQLNRVFVSCWAIRPSESSGMWMHYADHGRGIAIKTTVGKLRNASWRIPFHLSGLDTSDVVFYGLLLRRVRYLSFTNKDRITSLDDCYVPFLKREEFDDERELRMLGLTTSAIPMDGLVLHCRLAELIDELVTGPRADDIEIKRLLAEKVPLMQHLPLRRSTLSK